MDAQFQITLTITATPDGFTIYRPGHAVLVGSRVTPYTVRGRLVKWVIHSVEEAIEAGFYTPDPLIAAIKCAGTLHERGLL